MSRRPAAVQMDLIPPSPEERAEAEAMARERIARTERTTPVSFVEMWVIRFDEPGHAGKYVMRRHFLFHGTTYMPKSTAQEHKIVEHEDIEEVRRLVPPGLFRIVPKDDAVTKEMWI